ncbi:MAG: hypothetical protein H0X30_04955 [Anaerolineae bacterium]|nr:hypothetical protein [Anaerolineae bacterium]
MNTNALARHIWARFQRSNLFPLTDEALRSIADAPPAGRERLLALRYSGGRTGDLTELTDSELQQILDNLPPLAGTAMEY